MVTNILVVEDDQDLNQYLKEFLLDNGFAVQTTFDGASALKAVHESKPDLVVLDLQLPDIEGETVCQEIKKIHPELPVVILTAKHTTQDIVRGLNLGADDYMSKPFTAEELLARIKARLRSVNSSDTKLVMDDLELDPQTVEVKRAGKRISLTQTEFQLLHYLMSNKGRVLTREMILNRVWSYNSDAESRVVDVYVGYLRKKIDQDFPKKLIRSVRGFGYMIKD